MPNPPIPQLDQFPDDVVLWPDPVTLVLLPVRLETRYLSRSDGRFDLCVRVYPDKIHIDSHEPELTADELTWGRAFWEQMAHAADENVKKAAWRQLADRFGAPRASWVSRVLVEHGPQAHAADPKKDAWTRAPRARLLPSAWMMVGYKDGEVVLTKVGEPIQDNLATGPDPGAAGVTVSEEQLQVDEEMKWLFDFKAAERVGMGIRVTIREEAASRGLDFLVVAGVRNKLDHEDEYTLSKLFEAHEHTSGLSFVPPGTPSNNTPGAPSGFSSEDPGHDASYAAEFHPPAPGDSDSNAYRLAYSFGLPGGAKPFARIPHAAAHDHLDARHMNNALWPASWGYFLTQMLGMGGQGENPLKDNHIQLLWGYFITHVRANGPLPALRVGKQPYGVLPVTSLKAFKVLPGLEAGLDPPLRDFLEKLLVVWRLRVEHVPHLGRARAELDGASNVAQDMVEILHTDGLSSGYLIRHLFGQQYVKNLWSYMIVDLEGHRWWEIQKDITSWALNAVGATWRPRVANAVYSPAVVELDGPLVHAGAPDDKELTPNYIKALLAARDFKAILHGAHQPPSAPVTLLSLLLRHSMLLEYVNGGTWLLIARGLMQREEMRELEFVNHSYDVESTDPFTLWTAVPAKPNPLQRLFTTIKVREGEGGEMDLPAYMFGFMPPGEADLDGEPDVERAPQLSWIKRFRDTLRYLENLPPARLEYLMRGTLDLCSHRLDAWITALATGRLSHMRQVAPKQTLVGGYGWVMNLKMTPAGSLTRVEPPPPGETAPVFHNSDNPGEPAPVFHNSNNPGFVHAPSLAQASTAAVLRSGHLAHAGRGADAAAGDPLEIDLSSRRVRLAQWLLDGVRQGQPLGALLGYRFERRLQEAGLARYIAPFRQLAPLAAPELEHAAQPVEAVPANNVVDGLELLRRWQRGVSTKQWDGGTIPFGKRVPPQETLLPSNAPDGGTLEEYRRVFDEFALLERDVDAVGDALLSESVYQVVRGNPLRAASTVESVAGGESPPPELEVVRTQRTGVALTHRLLALFSGDPATPPGWETVAHPERAEAEPHLNAWAARLLGNPGKVRCLVELFDPKTGATLDSKDVFLNQLSLSPLDFVYAVEGGRDGGHAEIEQRIIYYVHTHGAEGFPPGTPLRVSTKRSPNGQADELSYGEFSEVLRGVRRLLSGVRAIDAVDVSPPERNVVAGVTGAELDELEKRAKDAGKSLTNTNTKLGEADLDELRKQMLRAAAFGVSGAVPLSAAGSSPADQEVLLAQAESIRKEVGERVAQLPEFPEGEVSETLSDEFRLERALTLLRVAFGKSFVVLPRFKPAPADAEELALAFRDSTKVQGGDPLASATWLLRMARVRDGVARLDAALSNAEAVGAAERLALSVAQLPRSQNSEDGRWVALPLEAERDLPGGKLSLVVQSGAPPNVSAQLAGVLVDEWVEVVPSAAETTGISFQYDQPNAAPPQTILVAVLPDVGAPWTLGSLQRVLLETLDLARIRAVDTEAMGEIRHFLPALYLAHNVDVEDTVSTDLGHLRRRES